MQFRCCRGVIAAALLLVNTPLMAQQAASFTFPSILGRSMELTPQGNFRLPPSATQVSQRKWLEKTPASVSTPVVHFAWYQIEKSPLESLPRWTEANLAALLNQPSCRLLQTPSTMLLEVADPQRIVSPMLSALDPQDVRLNNELNGAKESVAYLRYRRTNDPAERPRDLVLVPYTMAAFYASYLRDHPFSHALNLVAFVDTQLGPLLVFDTWLSGSPHSELELVGGGLENSLLYNPLRVEAQAMASGKTQVRVQFASIGELTNMEMSAAGRQATIRMIHEYFGTEASRRNASAGNALSQEESLLGGARPGSITMELLDDHNSLVATGTPDQNMVTVLDVPTPSPGAVLPRIFLLVVHHAWGRDIHRPVSIW